MGNLKIKEGYYRNKYLVECMTVYVTKVTHKTVTFSVACCTYTPGTHTREYYSVGTVHEMRYSMFSTFYSPYPKLKGMLLDGSNNE